MGDLEIQVDYDFLKECLIFRFHLMVEIFEVLSCFCMLNAKYYTHYERFTRW